MAHEASDRVWGLLLNSKKHWTVLLKKNTESLFSYEFGIVGSIVYFSFFFYIEEEISKKRKLWDI